MPITKIPLLYKYLYTHLLLAFYNLTYSYYIILIYIKFYISSLFYYLYNLIYCP